tara:strand:+ start:1908 stop:2099 length:192 start_codon:yes stop_codon:yes gene_type:complete
MKIPKNTLYQYLEKEHLDIDNKLTKEQWNIFVEKNSSSFAESCSRVGLELFADFYYAEENNDE